MHDRMLSRAALLFSLGLAGCAVGPNYHAPEVAPPATFTAAASPTASTPAADLSHWWGALHDATLDSLIDRAIEANPDAQIALLHLQEAREQEAGLVGSALPAVTASAVGGHGTGSDLSRMDAAAPMRAADNKGSLNQIQQVAGFSVGWELDVFGGQRRGLEAGRDTIESAAAARDAALLSVIGDVAHDYINLRGLQTRLRIVRSDVAAATQSRDLVQARFERGITNELDLQLASRELGSLRAQVPLLESQVSQTEYSIAALLGQYPESLAAELASAAPLPALLPPVDPGLPVELLRRRPDVAAAERDLAAATARIGVATANLFPHLVLSGALGTQSATTGLIGTHIWSLGPALYWPLLDFGQLDAQVKVADLRAQEARQKYRRTVINAVTDADQSIVNYQAQQQRLLELRVAFTASQRAYTLAQERYERGLTDYLNVVDSQRQQYQLEDSYRAARQSALNAYIQLCLALGGGWESYQRVPDIPIPLPAAAAGMRALLTR
jgi:NodT family efflux transporter outer membrane factor (OMF) lipoprotein